MFPPHTLRLPRNIVPRGYFSLSLSTLLPLLLQPCSLDSTRPPTPTHPLSLFLLFPSLSVISLSFLFFSFLLPLKLPHAKLSQLPKPPSPGKLE